MPILPSAEPDFGAKPCRVLVAPFRNLVGTLTRGGPKLYQDPADTPEWDSCLISAVCSSEQARFAGSDSIRSQLCELCPESETMRDLKDVVFHPVAMRELKVLPKPIRVKVGQALLALQRGHALGMPVLRTLPSVGSGLAEIRVHDATGQYRVLCVPHHPRGVLVLRAFAKKSCHMPQSEADLVRRRRKELGHAED